MFQIKKNEYITIMILTNESMSEPIPVRVSSGYILTPEHPGTRVIVGKLGWQAYLGASVSALVAIVLFGVWIASIVEHGANGTELARATAPANIFISHTSKGDYIKCAPDGCKHSLTLLQYAYDSVWTNTFCGHTEELLSLLFHSATQSKLVDWSVHNLFLNTLVVYQTVTHEFSNDTVEWAHARYDSLGSLFIDWYTMNTTFDIRTCDLDTETFEFVLTYPEDPLAMCRELDGYNQTNRACGRYEHYSSALHFHLHRARCTLPSDWTHADILEELFLSNNCSVHLGF